MEEEIARERRLSRNRDKQKKKQTKKTQYLELEITVMEGRRQDRHEEIHTRKERTHRSVVRELGVQKIALSARRTDAKQARGGKITPDHPSSERRNNQDCRGDAEGLRGKAATSGESSGSCDCACVPLMHSRDTAMTLPPSC